MEGSQVYEVGRFYAIEYIFPQYYKFKTNVKTAKAEAKMAEADPDWPGCLGVVWPLLQSLPVQVSLVVL